MHIDTEALVDDLRGCVIGEIKLIDCDVHVVLETPRREPITLCCTQATLLNAADQVAGLPQWAEWARTIDWAEVFGTDTLGLTLCNGLQLFIRTTGAELTQCYGR